MKCLISTLLSLAVTLSFAQDSEFKSLVEDIKSNLMEVQTGDETYSHQLDLLNTSVLKYTLTEEDSKGNREELSYEFNVADLDPYLVREETRKDIIYLNMTVDNGQKFIKEFKDGEVSGYEESLTVVTKDIDNARKLKELFKKAIPLAEEIMSNKLSIETYEEMENWLTEHVTNAESGSKTYNQTLISLDDFPANFRLIQTEIGSKSSEEKQYVFNLSDININTLKFNISGSSFSLDFETKRKQKLIQAFEEGAPKGFDDEIKIFTNNVEEARDLKNVLTMAAPLAEDKVEASIKTFDQQGDAYNYLTSFIENIDYGDDSYEQQIEGDCRSNFTVLDISPKTVEKHRYVFNLLDINPNLIDYDVSGDEMYVELKTKESTDLIKDYENDEHDKYINELRIYTTNIEKARRLKEAFVNIVKICESNYKDPFEGQSLDQKIDWLTKSLGEIRVDDETITQKFERNDGADSDKIKLTRLTVDSKSSTEEIFEFNFSDLNPKSIGYDIRGKNLAVSFETKFKEDIIKHYKNGEIENYQDGFRLSLTDIEMARNIILVFNQIIEALNE